MQKRAQILGKNSILWGLWGMMAWGIQVMVGVRNILKVC